MKYSLLKKTPLLCPLAIVLSVICKYIDIRLYCLPKLYSSKTIGYWTSKHQTDPSDIRVRTHQLITNSTSVAHFSNTEQQLLILALCYAYLNIGSIMERCQRTWILFSLQLSSMVWANWAILRLRYNKYLRQCCTHMLDWCISTIWMSCDLHKWKASENVSDTVTFWNLLFFFFAKARQALINQLDLPQNYVVLSLPRKLGF